MDVKTLEAAFAAAFDQSIRKMGLSAFKQTSFFGSNERVVELKKAA